MRITKSKAPQVFKHQDESYTVTATPVSGTKYEWKTGATGTGADLGTQKNVRIISIYVRITWATTQPTPLEVHVTIDGQTITFAQTNPVSTTAYRCILNAYSAKTDQPMATATNLDVPFLLEGRSVKVEAEITWATTQPTDLTMRVKWAKME